MTVLELFLLFLCFEKAVTSKCQEMLMKVILTRVNSADLTNSFVQYSSLMIFRQLKFEDNDSEEKWELKVVFAPAVKPACTFLSKI